MTSPQTPPTPQQQPPPAQGGTAPAEPTWSPTTQTSQTQQTPQNIQTSQTAPTAGQAERPPEAPTERHDGEVTGQEQHAGKVLHLHTAHPQVPIPYLTPGDMVTSARAAASRLPAPRKLAFYGLLGGMAALELLEWPIAVAIGAATEVISREQAKHAEQEGRRQPATEPSARTEPSGTTRTAMA